MTNQGTYGVVLLVIAAAIAIATAIAHLSCIYLGPACYAAQLAPPSIIESAQAGTLFAPIATILVSAIFILLACYALSGAQIIIRLPLLSLGIYTIATLCIIRGLLPFILQLSHDIEVQQASAIASLIWLFTGLCYGFGFLVIKRK